MFVDDAKIKVEDITVSVLKEIEDGEFYFTDNRLSRRKVSANEAMKEVNGGMIDTVRTYDLAKSA